jgi:putative membrane protein
MLPSSVTPVRQLVLRPYNRAPDLERLPALTVSAVIRLAGRAARVRGCKRHDQRGPSQHDPLVLTFRLPRGSTIIQIQEYVMKFTLALATTCALLSAPAFAQSTTAQSTTAPHTTCATLAGTTISTPEFVNKIILSNMLDDQAARLAEQRGNNTEQNFSRQVVLDHTKATNALKTMMNTGKVNADIPTALDCEHQQKFAELQNLWGQSFDDGYSRDLLQSDQNEISLFEHYAQNGDNATLRQWATKMLPELKSHLVYAQLLGGEGHAGPAREEWQSDATV